MVTREANSNTSRLPVGGIRTRPEKIHFSGTLQSSRQKRILRVNQFQTKENSMAQPTVFVQFETQNKSNPVAMAISLIAKSAGSVLADQLVDDQGNEADIAVTNKVETTLRLLKETKNTIVFLGYLYSSEFCASKEEALAFAARFPERVKAGPFIEATGEENLLTTLMNTIKEMGKENDR